MRSLVVKSETIFQCESNEPLANFLVFFFLWENIEEAVLMIVNDADSAENRSVRRPR